MSLRRTVVIVYSGSPYCARLSVSERRSNWELVSEHCLTFSAGFHFALLVLFFFTSPYYFASFSAFNLLSLCVNCYSVITFLLIALSVWAGRGSGRIPVSPWWNYNLSMCDLFCLANCFASKTDAHCYLSWDMGKNFHEFHSDLGRSKTCHVFVRTWKYQTENHSRI